MAEEQTMMPGNTPEWVKEAEEQMKKEGTLEPQEKKEISIKFGKGLVGEPFTSKRGNQLVEVKIPEDLSKSEIAFLSKLRREREVRSRA